MGLSLWSLVASVAFLLGLINTAEALNCFQCNSSRNSDCREILGDENPLTSGGCDLFEAKYCIKTTGIWGGIVGTFRFCSAKDLGNQCQYIVYPDHDRVYRACSYTCLNDDCNGTPGLPKTSLTLLILAAVAVYFLR